MPTPAHSQPLSSLVLGDFVNKLVCDGAMTVQQGNDLMAIVRRKDESHAALVAALEGTLGALEDLIKTHVENQHGKVLANSTYPKTREDARAALAQARQ